MKKIIEKIPITIIILIIIISTLLIGTPLDEDNIRIVFVISAIFSIYYYIIKKEKILKDKIDICVIILAFSALIPLIFKTYTSMSGTIYYAMKYFCILNIFLITKHECKKNPQYIDIILNTIIISILIQCIIGLDEIWGNYLEYFRNLIGYVNIGLKESRVGGLFAYANTMAAVAGMGIFLCMGYIFSDKSIKIKLLYIAISIIMLITMILTYSRLVFIVFALISVIYFLILCKKYKIIKKINKKIFWITGIILGLVILYIIIGLQIPETLNVEDEYDKKFFNIQGDTDYNFTFDIEAISEKENSFVIEIIERNIYLDKIKTTEIKFDTFSGIKEQEIHTKGKTKAIYIAIKNKDKDGILNIKGMTLNGEKIILNYKLLPTNLVFKIQEISFNQKSVWQRLVYIQDAFKAIKENWIFGFGGNAWRSIQLEKQEYNYYTKEVHSYPIQTFLENGIFGFIACLGIGIYILKILYKEVKKQEMNIVKISSIIAISVILLHSIFDFDMSFLYVMLIIFIILSTMENNESKQHEKSSIIQKIIIILLIIISIVTIYILTIQIHFDIYKEKTIKDFETYYSLIPFDAKVNSLMHTKLVDEKSIYRNKQKEQLLYNMIKFEKNNTVNIKLINIHYYVEIVVENNQNVEEKLNFVLDYINNTEDFGKFRPDIQVMRMKRIREMVKVLNKNGHLEYAQKFNNQLMKEISEKEELILDYEKGRYSHKKVEEYRQSINNLKEFSEQFKVEQ